MGSPLALIEPKTSTCRDESGSSSSSPVNQAPCLQIYWTKPGVTNHFDRIWLPYDELPSSFPKQTIASQKLMITVVWNSRGFHVIQSLSNEIKGTGRYYSDNILSQIAVLWDGGSRRKMIVHADNSSPHVVKCVMEYMDHNSLNRVAQPPYSLDLVPSDLIYLHMSSINYRDMNSRKEQSLFRLSQKF
jgi:hypothetical protein